MIGNGRWWAMWVIKSLIKREKELLLLLHDGARHVDVFDLVGPFHNKVLTKVVGL